MTWQPYKWQSHSLVAELDRNLGDLLSSSSTSGVPKGLQGLGGCFVLTVHIYRRSHHHHYCSELDFPDHGTWAVSLFRDRAVSFPPWILPRQAKLHCIELRGVVYNMDREVVPRPCKIWDWMLNSSQNHFGCTKEKVSEWSWRSRSPKDIFWGLCYPLTWSNEFFDGRGKRGALVEKGRGSW